MYLFGKNIDKEVVFVAEIGVNHEGNLDKAIELIHLAKESNADAVKFQSYTPEKFASSTDQDRLKRVQNFALSKEDHLKLISESNKIGISFFSTSVSEDWVPFLEKNCECIKIASGDLNFNKLIEDVSKNSLPIILSTGLSTIEEIDTAVDIIKKNSPIDIREKLILLQCVASYPTPIYEANTRSVMILSKRYNVRVGYSNHVIGLEACFSAISLGACIIEAHFTDNKNDREFRDHALSTDPDDFKVLVSSGTKIKESLGSYDKVIQESEKNNSKIINKGIVCSCDIKKDTILTDKNLMYARPATFFHANDINLLLGKKLKVNKKYGELISQNDLDQD
ncbi:N-acetylneuraminate synthase family protein [Alphaproteobacteria bacterium]|nr:N-acetylneuraminate synthase family protein [Alphaproteobacteria bacterium]